MLGLNGRKGRRGVNNIFMVIFLSISFHGFLPFCQASFMESCSKLNCPWLLKLMMSQAVEETWNFVHGVFTFGSGANGLTEAYALLVTSIFSVKDFCHRNSLPITFLLICPSNPKNNLLNSPSFSLFCLVLVSFLGNCYNQPNIIKIYWSKTKIRTWLGIPHPYQNSCAMWPVSLGIIFEIFSFVAVSLIRLLMFYAALNLVLHYYKLPGKIKW